MSLKRDVASLKAENGALKSRSGPAELARLRSHAEERDAKVRDLEGLVGREVDLRTLAEVKCEDLKTHLSALECTNSELVDHTRNQMSRLRASRLDYGRRCARAAALRVSAELVTSAQASLTRAREYQLEQRSYLKLVSRASQVKTQLDDLDAMAEVGVEVVQEDKAQLQAKYDGLERELEDLDRMDFSDREYTFTPDPSILPSSFEVTEPSSPLGPKEFGIKESWMMAERAIGEGVGSGGERESPDPARRTC